MEHFVRVFIVTTGVLFLIFIIGKVVENHEEDRYQYQCYDGHVYYKSSKDQGFWYKTGRECK